MDQGLVQIQHERVFLVIGDGLGQIGHLHMFDNIVRDYLVILTQMTWFYKLLLLKLEKIGLILAAVWDPAEAVVYCLYHEFSDFSQMNFICFFDYSINLLLKFFIKLFTS